MRELNKTYNYVIIDSTPLGPVSDALVMSPHVDGTVLVVDQETPRQMVLRARSQLTSAGARILGVVMNRADPGSPGYAT